MDGDSIRTRPATDRYRSEWDRIFGDSQPDEPVTISQLSDAIKVARVQRMYEATGEPAPKPDHDLEKINQALTVKSKKVPLHLVPPALLIGAARAFAEGFAKYGYMSWRNAEVRITATDYVAGAMRHLMAFLDGEDVDPESSTGKLHLEGAVACLGIMLDCIQRGTLIDDRPIEGSAGKALRGETK